MISTASQTDKSAKRERGASEGKKQRPHEISPCLASTTNQVLEILVRNIQKRTEGITDKDSSVLLSACHRIGPGKKKNAVCEHMPHVASDESRMILENLPLMYRASFM
jgi:hypothetical protein